MIPIEPEAEELLGQLKNQGVSKERMRRALQYCIQVYDKVFDILEGTGMVRPISSDMEEFYELTAIDQYTEDMGLNLFVDMGMDLYL